MTDREKEVVRITSHKLYRSVDEIIRQRRQQILIHSIIYYTLNDSVISDAQWNTWSRELVELQNQHPNLSKLVMLYEEFKDFDGSTGFDLPLHDPVWVAKAQRILDYHNSLR